MESAYFRFYDQLNDFLRHREKHTVIPYQFANIPAIKDAIEAIGIPHPEVGQILVNGRPVHFSYPLQPGDQVDVYPFTVQPLPQFSLRGPIPVPVRFILDVHLGSLARTLRLLGFDVLYRNDYDDATIARLSGAEERIALTRDIGLLKQKLIVWGYWLRSQHTEEQAEEVISQFNLRDQIKPFTRCLACNGLIGPVSKEKVAAQLPEDTACYFHEFYQCASCRKVYWKGSHYDRMRSLIERLRA